jgi:hypothetical protein
VSTPQLAADAVHDDLEEVRRHADAAVAGDVIRVGEVEVVAGRHGDVDADDVGSVC